jgi:WD40 repeat protein
MWSNLQVLNLSHDLDSTPHFFETIQYVYGVGLVFLSVEKNA